jgi:hypothetical protein
MTACRRVAPRTEAAAPSVVSVAVLNSAHGPIGDSLSASARRNAPDQFPLNSERIFQLGWSIFRFAWRPIFGALTLAILPAYLLRICVDLIFGNTLFEWFTEFTNANEANLPAPPPPADFDAALAATLVADVVLFFCSLVATAAVIAIVSRVYSGERVGALSAVRDALGRLLSLIGGQLLLIVAILIVLMLALTLAATFLVGGGLFAFLGLIVLVGAVAAILFIVVRATFTSVAIVVEQVGGADGFRRSWRVAADHGWRVLGYLVLVGLIGLLVTIAVAFVPTLLNPLPTGSPADTIYVDVTTLIAAIVAAPVAPIVLTLLYVDLRWRHGERVPAPGGGEVDGRPPEPGA